MTPERMEKICAALVTCRQKLVIAEAERNDAVSLLVERDEEMDKVRNRAADAEFLAREMAEALERVLLDIDFMVEDGTLRDIRGDIIYIDARRALSQSKVTP